MKKLFVWLAGVSICAAQAVSIGPFATEDWVEERIKDAESVTNGLAAKAYVDERDEEIEARISGFATVEQVEAVSNAIPSVAGLATVEQVTAVSNLLPDVTDFATRQWVGQSITNAVDDLVVEWDSVTNKPVNVDPADGALKTNGRLKNGTYTSVNNKYSFASGEWLDVQSKGSVALGHQVSIPSSSSYTFAWSGDPSDNRYTSNGAGTFNVNPVGGTEGFYVGTNKLSDLLSGGGGISTEIDPIFKSWADDNTNSLLKTEVDPAFTNWLATTNVVQYSSVTGIVEDIIDYVAEDNFVTGVKAAEDEHYIYVWGDEFRVEDFTTVVTNATAGNIAAIDTNGNLVDSGVSTNLYLRRTGGTMAGSLDMSSYSIHQVSPFGKEFWIYPGMLRATGGYELYFMTNNVLKAGTVATEEDLAGFADRFVEKSGGTMTGGLTVPDLTVGSRPEGVAVGVNSVAEGEQAAAIGNSSHAEGYGTTASGDYSHSEGGGNTASGLFSHAEGSFTVANGDSSHTEGYDTITQNNAEHAQGRYNASHTGDTAADRTIHSIGIGEPDARANAVEVMQDGKVFINGVGGYDGTNPTTATNLATCMDSMLHAINGVGEGDFKFGNQADAGGPYVGIGYDDTTYAPRIKFFQSAANPPYIEFADGTRLYSATEADPKWTEFKDTHRIWSKVGTSGTSVTFTNTVVSGALAVGAASDLRTRVLNDLGLANGVVSIEAGGIYSTVLGLNAVSSNQFAFVYSGRGETEYADHGAGTFNVDPYGGAEGFWIGETNLATYLSSESGYKDRIKTSNGLNEAYVNSSGVYYKYPDGYTLPVTLSFNAADDVHVGVETFPSNYTVVINAAVQGQMNPPIPAVLEGISTDGKWKLLTTNGSGYIYYVDGSSLKQIFRLEGLESNYFSITLDPEVPVVPDPVVSLTRTRKYSSQKLATEYYVDSQVDLCAIPTIFQEDNAVQLRWGSGVYQEAYFPFYRDPSEFPQASQGAITTNGNGSVNVARVDSNTVSGNDNFVFGNSNSVFGDNVTVFGNGNLVTNSSGAAVLGPASHTVKGSAGSIVSGNGFNNLESSPYSIITGVGGTTAVNSGSSFVLSGGGGGVNNSPNATFLAPMGTSVYDSQNIIIGGYHHNVVSNAPYSVVLGGTTVVTNSYVFMWNGGYGQYADHGPRTFNVNPADGTDGFYVGENSLTSLLALDAIAPAFLPENVYTNGDYVMKDRHLYECTNYTGTAGWDANSWQQTSVTGILGNLRKILDEINGEAL